MTTENTNTETDAAQDVATPQDAAARERHVTMLELIRVNAILKHRKDACERLIEENQKKLSLLMNDSKLRKLVAFEGTAKFTNDRCFAVVSVEALMKTFSKEQLAQGFKPSATFVDAAVKAGINIKPAITIGTNPGFEMARSQSKQAREQQEQIVEETRRQLEKTVAELAERLRASTKE